MIELTLDEMKYAAEMQGKVLSNGHIYKIYFDVDSERAADEVIANALAILGVTKIQHVTDGGTNVAVTRTIGFP